MIFRRPLYQHCKIPPTRPIRDRPAARCRRWHRACRSRSICASSRARCRARSGLPWAYRSIPTCIARTRVSRIQLRATKRSAMAGSTIAGDDLPRARELAQNRCRPRQVGCAEQDFRSASARSLPVAAACGPRVSDPGKDRYRHHARIQTARQGRDVFQACVVHQQARDRGWQRLQMGGLRGPVRRVPHRCCRRASSSARQERERRTAGFRHRAATKNVDQVCGPTPDLIRAWAGIDSAEPRSIFAVNSFASSVKRRGKSPLPRRATVGTSRARIAG